MAEKKSESRVSFWESLLALLGTQPAFLKHALSAALALAVVGGAWSGRQAWRYGQEIAQIRAQQATSQDQMQDLQRQLGEQRSRNLQLDEELQRQGEQRSKTGLTVVPRPSLASLALSLGRVRDTGSLKTPVLPSSANPIPLRLQLSENLYPSYRAVLQDAKGSEIWILNQLRAQRSGADTVVVFTLPTKLPPDDYAVKLSGMNSQGDFDDIGKYYFRVPRK